MKKPPFALALLAGLLMGQAHAADGRIHFDGVILDAGCTIDAADLNQTVTLGRISKTAFSVAGNFAAPREFAIQLTACPAALLTASASFDGPTDITDNRLLAVNGGAAGVAVGIYEKNSTTLIPVGTRSAGVNLAGSAGMLEFIAKYVATSPVASIVPGTANAVAQFTLSYN